MICDRNRGIVYLHGFRLRCLVSSYCVTGTMLTEHTKHARKYLLAKSSQHDMYVTMIKCAKCFFRYKMYYVRMAIIKKIRDNKFW